MMKQGPAAALCRLSRGIQPPNSGLTEFYLVKHFFSENFRCYKRLVSRAFLRGTRELANTYFLFIIRL